MVGIPNNISLFQYVRIEKVSSCNAEVYYCLSMCKSMLQGISKFSLGAAILIIITHLYVKLILQCLIRNNEPEIYVLVTSHLPKVLDLVYIIRYLSCTHHYPMFPIADREGEKYCTANAASLLYDYVCSLCDRVTFLF